MQAQDIKQTLKSLIKEASTIDPSLAKRLEQIDRWVQDVKSGSLNGNTKRFLRLFLEQIIKDSQIWLDIQALSSQEEQEVYYTKMTATEKYWFRELFAKWLKENDPKFIIWRQKLMAGDFRQEDGDLLNSVVNSIEVRGGTVIKRYIADLSMATDIIVSSRQDKALCIQLTSLANKYSQEKSDSWENTLRFWAIERGLFLNYNPGKNDFINKIVNLSLHNSDNLKSRIYLKFSL
ncbi:hypothetical protein [Fischerella thermalis]|uniref:hypothetical protein n=1 Tax=Fischerella thermalis TaxID=372787 RepID=UPI000C806FB9|nr:hypothetical protein [Fischerella thermalis]PLZ06810.1 hypothetical protein CBP18_17800 [Fischerella thermalis WC119]PLZ12624.1 hypothetical protein CBP17_06910 [Fischerella thermalis WC114]PLZ14083.1 hypothetical protein CBP19_09040 [Fischerella thermalis WC1110]PLZ18900.1 hypothetical protein CBP30_15485 [Fischerella thermalis WC157]PLZ36860.1 hypothetical protein CBP26_20100 [Fischerella thermalis WC538]